MTSYAVTQFAERHTTKMRIMISMLLPTTLYLTKYSDHSENYLINDS